MKVQGGESRGLKSISENSQSYSWLNIPLNEETKTDLYYNKMILEFIAGKGGIT